MADNDKNVEKSPRVQGESAPQKLTADTDYIKKNNDAGKVRLIKQYALYLADSTDTAFVMPTSTDWTPPEGHFPIGYSKEDGAVLHPETGDETEIKAHNGDIVYSSVDGGYWTLQLGAIECKRRVVNVYFDQTSGVDAVHVNGVTSNKEYKLVLAGLDQSDKPFILCAERVKVSEREDLTFTYSDTLTFSITFKILTPAGTGKNQFDIFGLAVD